MHHIVTDSLADLADDFLAEHGISLVASYVTFGSETLHDRVDITPRQFFKRLVETRDAPTTSQPSVADFEAQYRELGADVAGTAILSIHCSAGISGTIESARQAATRFPQADIRLFDTRSLSCGLGLMVTEAANMSREGAPAEKILARLRDMRDGMRAYYMVDTLDYLAKGGRIGRAARLLGLMLDIKPLLTLSDGVVAPVERLRSRERAIAGVRDHILEIGRGRKGIRLGVAHALCEDDAQHLADDLNAELKPEVFIMSEIGPAIGAYTGPGAIGAFIWPET
jgi:DegV family protein with EDD domain